MWSTSNQSMGTRSAGHAPLLRTSSTHARTVVLLTAGVLFISRSNNAVREGTGARSNSAACPNLM